MQVIIEESPTIKRASASLRAGDVVFVKLPKTWSHSLKQDITKQLLARITKQANNEKQILLSMQGIPKISLCSREALERFVHQINQETFQVNLGRVQIGHAKYTQLAQLNIKTKTMTVSQFCIQDVPVAALRYLIIHELAHYFEGGHGKRFWALVSRYVPDYKIQSKIIKAFHHQQVIASG